MERRSSGRARTKTTTVHYLPELNSSSADTADAHSRLRSCSSTLQLNWLRISKKATFGYFLCPSWDSWKAKRIPSLRGTPPPTPTPTPRQTKVSHTQIEFQTALNAFLTTGFVMGCVLLTCAGPSRVCEHDEDQRQNSLLASWPRLESHQDPACWGRPSASLRTAESKHTWILARRAGCLTWRIRLETKNGNTMIFPCQILHAARNTCMFFFFSFLKKISCFIPSLYRSMYMSILPAADSDRPSWRSPQDWWAWSCLQWIW